MAKWVKGARGIEIPIEALTLLLQQRFPNIVDWDHLDYPKVDYDVQHEILRLYWSQRFDATPLVEPLVEPIFDRALSRPFEGQYRPVAYPLRRVAEGAPIPVGLITTDRLVATGRYVVSDSPGPARARCGVFPDDHQCVYLLGHAGDHAVRHGA